ncbi:hypothetical protein [Haloplanus aerogenes]|uniref:Uncharacterized protein n=1 Tax=Haloplanus aerogenes TaxID=660522 RepID=A0A3M0CWL2_9EURY|nr:hypothetical protein [Haloplanus aerogenes]AZH25171.1 hypothetical protein DU502_07170 [Haloplanus aerogenes]RMB13601.1 hypothetical protein ATH50_2040 [Haloplanus aerogenes]
MTPSLRTSVTDAIRNAIPFLVITGLWIVIMLAVYGVFLVTKPDGITYSPWVHASVFAVPGVGFLGHVLQQALAGGRA